MELINSEVQLIKDEFVTDPNEAAFRNEPENVGFGLEIKLDSTHEDGESGYCSDMDIRLDLLSLAITDESLEPYHKTPSVHLRTDLKVYDTDGEQGWLHGGPLEADRLRSIETSVSWNHNGWNAELILNDASHNGVVDWGSEVPAQQRLGNGSNSNYCLPECLNKCLSINSNDWIATNAEANAFLSTLETIGISKINLDSQGQPESWSIIESNLTNLELSPDPYLNSLLTDQNSGNWNLNKTLSSGSSFFSHLCSRISGAELVDEIGNDRNGSIKFFIPVNSRNQGIYLYIKPEGTMQVELRSYSISGLSVSGIVELDFAGEAQSSSNDGMTLFVDLDCYLSFSELGMFSSSYFRVFYDEKLLGDERLTVDLHLPSMGKVLSPLNQLDQVDDGNATWISSPDSIRIYPPPQVGQMNLIEFLSSTSPTLILESIVRTAIDAFVLLKLENECLIGEVLEVLDLVEHLPDGRYRCASLLDFASSPRVYLQSIFIIDDGVNVSKLLELAGAVMRAFDLPHRLLDSGGNVVENDDISEVVFDIRRGQDSPWAEIAVMVHSQDPNGVTLAIRSPELNDTPRSS